eukprot:503564_1
MLFNNSQRREYFHVYGQNVKTNNDKTTITNHTYFANTAYGFVTMNQLIHKWKFKINKNVGSICIGIDESQCKWINQGFCFKKETSNYSYASNGCKYESGVATKNYGPSYGDNDVIVMSLNCKSNKLSFKLNGETIKNDAITINKKTKYKKTKYKMAVFLHGNGANVSLLSYEKFSGKNDNTDNYRVDEKMQVKGNVECSGCDSFKLIVDSILKKNDALNRTNKQLKQESEKQQNRIMSLIQQNNKLKNDNGKLMEEQKQCQLRIIKLKEENKQLKLKNLNINDYKDWNWEEILIWILSLNDGQYSKYKNQLQITMKEEGPSGKDLSDVNEVDIKRWGVTNFRDIKDLAKSLKKLVNDNNEGSVIAQTQYI